MNKYKHFLEIAERLNHKFAVTPLLFGSLGLQIRVSMDLQADDIDILVPGYLLADGWNDLVEQMNDLGYHLHDLHEHEFHCGDIHAAYAAVESLGPFAGVDYTAIPAVSDGAVSYLLLSLDDYLKVYTASAKDGYRADKKHKNDSAKIDLIQSALCKRNEKE